MKKIGMYTISFCVSLMGTFLLYNCGGGGGSAALTETDLFTRMIGYYQVDTEYYTNEVLTYSNFGCDSLQPYNTWSMFFEDMDTDTTQPGYLTSSLVYTSNSVRYELSWEEGGGVTCTDFEEYVFGNHGETFSYEYEEVCSDGSTRRQLKTGNRLGALDTPNDAIGEAIALEADTPVSVTLDAGDMDFFTFTLNEAMNVEAHFENFTGSISGLNHDLYYGERWGPAGGWGGSTVPSSNTIVYWDLEANTYYLTVYADKCTESGTFTLTMTQP
jgi:hypothetical protein